MDVFTSIWGKAFCQGHKLNIYIVCSEISRDLHDASKAMQKKKKKKIILIKGRDYVIKCFLL